MRQFWCANQVISPKEYHGWLVKLIFSIFSFALLCFIAVVNLSASAYAQDAQDIYEGPYRVPDTPSRRFIGVPDADNIFVQNITGTAWITVTFYPFSENIETADSSEINHPTDFHSLTAILPPQTTKVYTTPDDFDGSVTIAVSSSVGISPTVNVTNLYLSEQGNNAYLGRAAASEESALAQDMKEYSFLVPPIMMNPTDETDRTKISYCLQNLEAEFDAEVTILLYGSDTGAPIADGPYTVPPGESVCPEPAGDGSVVIQTNQLVFVNRILIEDAFRGLRASYSTTPGALADKKILVPALFKNWERQTSLLCVQATQTGATTVDVFYTDGVTETFSLETNRRKCFDQGAENHVDAWAGGAFVSASGPVVATVWVTARDANKVYGYWSYTPSSQSSAYTEFAFPIILNGYRQWESTIFLYNPGDITATVTSKYVLTKEEVWAPEPLEIAPNSVHVVSLQDLPANFSQISAYFKSNVPLAAVMSATSTKNLRDISDRHFGYEAAGIKIGEAVGPGPGEPLCATCLYVPIVQQ